MSTAEAVDLRSDTVTRPTAAMRRAMSEAEVGDDVLGDDPTVLALQDEIARTMGKEAACFVPSGTMANQTAIRAHTEPGDEIIAHKDSHIIHYETGSPAALSGVMVHGLDGELGQFDAEDVRSAVRARNAHHPWSKLLIVENTQNRGGGSVWPMDRVEAVTDAAREAGLKTHLDGARIWNACVASGIAASAYAKHFDTVSCCFSKGLGAPAGSAVCGDARTIARVHRFRKMFGGAMRQAGVLASACLHALEHHRERLADDHRRAQTLAQGVSAIPGLSVRYPVQTNMVFIELQSGLGTAAAMSERLAAIGVRMLPNQPQVLRAVCHLDVDDASIERALEALERCAGRVHSASV